jgi:hypothetical protein
MTFEKTIMASLVPFDLMTHSQQVTIVRMLAAQGCGDWDIAFYTNWSVDMVREALRVDCSGANAARMQ